MEIQGFKDYLIYPDGKIFSNKSQKFMKLYHDKDGYLICQINSITKRVHRLVAENYISNPNNLSEVDHINRKRDDNRIANLRWIDRKNNSINRGINKNKTISFKWISKRKTRNEYIFKRINCKTKSSNNLSKLLCYSFFYIIKQAHKDIK